MALDIEKLEDSPNLLDILIQLEDILDSLDVYVYKNWYKGEVVEGPIIKRYWISFTLRYDLNHMPDPKAMLRLFKHGIRVNYKKITEDARDGEEKGWVITISVPRRLIDQMNAAELDYYDEDVDVDDVEAAQDMGMNDETPYKTDEGLDDNIV